MALLAEEGGLLIARDSCDWNSIETFDFDLGVNFAAGADFRHHEQALESRSFLRVASLLLLAIVIGVISGYFFKMSARTLDATRFMNTTLQTASQDSKSPVRNLPSFQQHAGMKYQLLHKASATSTEGFDVRAEYEDGYTVQCTVVVYPDTNPYISDCTLLQK